MILFAYGYWTIYIVDRTLFWYFHLPATERSIQDAGLIGTVITGVSGLFTWCLKFYMSSGRQWAGQPATEKKDD